MLRYLAFITLSLLGLSFEDRQTLLDVQGSEWEFDPDDDVAMATLPPGEEGMFLSHAGGEDELCRSLFEENTPSDHM